MKYDPTLGETPIQTAATLVEPLQKEALIMAGHGKKHGSYMLVDDHIDPATLPSQIRAFSTSESFGVQPHGQRAITMISDLQVCSFTLILLALTCLHCYVDYIPMTLGPVGGRKETSTRRA